MLHIHTSMRAGCIAKGLSQQTNERADEINGLEPFLKSLQFLR